MAPLRTARLTLRPWREADRPAFAALNADPEVAADLGGPLARAASDAKLDRYRPTFERHGFGRLAIEDAQQVFAGYAGVMPSTPGHPHTEIGWRLVRAAWGKGYASEAARAVLEDAFARLGIRELLAYTAADNARSQAVMARLAMRRDPARDFDTLYGDTPWHGLVWVAEMRRDVTQV
ncbi:MAG: GNAT family N-acetyltransferase [Reyranella sp.]|uniref:GNAT family N-acetyltransferase n=1 Tax=Reyranella sp. TaxID=1929291 RepID=UPI001AC11868|nr:GNAT family N-acetyltransferase [Reyranella sp.]MBN9090182.1 GNAT family N-acetyltransferase [Reyranella sp.]